MDLGGVAVSVRTEPRFTRDLDFAIAVANDDEAARYVFDLRQCGYVLHTALEQTARGRLSTVRLRHRRRLLRRQRCRHKECEGTSLRSHQAIESGAG